MRYVILMIVACTLDCSAAPVENDRQASRQEPILEEVPPGSNSGAVRTPKAPLARAPKASPGPRVPVLDCTPVEEVGYRHGRKFPITVISVDGRFVEIETANTYWAMQLAAAKEGIELPIYSGFRNHQQQEYFYNCHKTCSCNSCSPAAKPGHSKHQSGSAIDFGQWPGVIDWLNKHGRKFRFYPTVPREPWHWEYRPRSNKLKRKGWPSPCAQSEGVR